MSAVADPTGAWLLVLLPLPLTIPVSVIDLRRRIIPDALNLALLLLGLAVLACRAGLWAGSWPAGAQAAGSGLAQAGLAFLLFWCLRALHARLRGRIGLGLGDVKFIAAATPWTGLEGLPVLVLAASLTALAAIGLGALAGRRIGRTTRLPFGPFLALGLHVAMLVGPPA